MVSPQSARIATVFIEAIYRAAREGRAVDLAK
ncbi:MAG: hypothetical protein BWZ10_02871 [candidate division BRC1 bacterium ADurb.BinA364]|nr:MAG: hypothetical protein BWZ10_02871 [candidate division BRC1 bacterium ADurb.BinA364]